MHEWENEIVLKRNGKNIERKRKRWGENETAKGKEKKKEQE